MTFELHRHDARHISELLEPESADAIVTSPPYLGLRSYRDTCQFCNGAKALTWNDGITRECPECHGSGSAHYDGQLGSEATPTAFVDALIECTADWLKVLKPTGSLFVNLGDKYNSAASNHQTAIQAGWSERHSTGWDNQQTRGTTSPGIPAKSKMGLPWRYAIRCIDELGLILRADIIWNKPNGLPESVQDRVRSSHEYLFHFTRQGKYFAAIDEVREAGDAGNPGTDKRPKVAVSSANGTNHRELPRNPDLFNPLGKVPGSVWTIPSEPLQVPDHLGVDHFAAFPSELPRRCILGWTPSGWCTACGEARRPVVDRTPMVVEPSARRLVAQATGNASRTSTSGTMLAAATATITGYACACPTVDAPTTPAVVLDPFCGTGTTPAVAHLLGRHGIGIDLSADYLRLAEWRCTQDARLRSKVVRRSVVQTELNLFGDAP